jgi:hypothetical protein
MTDAVPTTETAIQAVIATLSEVLAQDVTAAAAAIPIGTLAPVARTPHAGGFGGGAWPGATTS